MFNDGDITNLTDSFGRKKRRKKKDPIVGIEPPRKKRKKLPIGRIDPKPKKPRPRDPIDGIITTPEQPVKPPKRKKPPTKPPVVITDPNPVKPPIGRIEPPYRKPRPKKPPIGRIEPSPRRPMPVDPPVRRPLTDITSAFGSGDNDLMKSARKVGDQLKMKADQMRRKNTKI